VLGVPVTAASIQELRTRVGLSSDALAVAIARHEVVRDVVLTAAHGVTSRQREGYEAMDLDRAEALLEAFGLADLASREFGTLSEGERKRAQLARSLMANPELLLLDEPAAGLDLAGREELLEALTHLATDPRAPVLILVTHHVEEIPRGFTHALVLARGGVVAAGPIEDVLTVETLSQVYGIPVVLDHVAGRWSARRA
jgi:iron complex transport system ATP-binding protein